ncbi:hypothetical protein [Rhizobium rhizogenes]|uniref:hypothetical protein n=1 Tax=Rhizobium rhizogenes TaxID=359 RepID=UPI001401BCF6|nr:hypothetical protein [Rhizobium rhizogenes]
MPASDFSALDRAQEEIASALAVARARVERVLGEAFENRDQAISALNRLLPTHGSEGVTQILCGANGWWDRMSHFGPYRLKLFNDATKRQVSKALAEAPEAVQSYSQLRQQLEDIKAARRSFLENIDGQRLQDRAPSRQDNRWRDRSRK